MYLFKRYVILLVSVLLATACKKNKDKQEEPEKVYETHQYTSGYHSANTIEQACYWKDTTRVTLDGGADKTGQAYNVFVTGNDIYVTGRTRQTPCYWKNGVRTDLSVLTTFGLAVYIYVSGDTVCVAGVVKNAFNQYIPCFWKNGARTDLPMLNNTASGEGSVSAIYMKDNIVYTAGHTKSTTSGFVPCYWRNDLRVTDLSKPFPTRQALSSGIAVAGTDVYVSGYAYDTSNLRIPCYWKNGVRTDLPKLNDSKDGDATDVYVNGADVYVTGSTNAASPLLGVPCYWKNGVRVDLFNSGPYRHAFASHLYLVDKDVYVAGFIQNASGTYIPCYWKNGVRSDSNIKLETDAFINRTITATH